MHCDPVVDEVRKTREQLAQRWRHKPAEMVTELEEIFEKWPGGKISYEDSLADRPPAMRVAEKKAKYGD